MRRYTRSICRFRRTVQTCLMPASPADEGMPMRRAVVLTIVATLVLSAKPAFAQWVKLDLTSTPKTATGQVDINAPTPRRPSGQPDLSGVWAAVADRRDVPPGAPDIPRNRHAANIGVDIPGGAPMTSWARVPRGKAEEQSKRSTNVEMLAVGYPTRHVEANAAVQGCSGRRHRRRAPRFIRHSPPLSFDGLRRFRTREASRSFAVASAFHSATL